MTQLNLFPLLPTVGLGQHVEKQLPVYARPLFARVLKAHDITGRC